MNLAGTELTAPEISCAKCQANIEGDLYGEPGIEQVTVDVGTRRVRIACDPERTGPDQVRAKLEAKADMTYLRYLYVSGSHLIHASAYGLGLTILDRESAGSDVFIRPSDTGLAQPAEASLNALIDVTGGLVLHGGDTLSVKLT
ncbi:MAG: heavy-metal-associated domain-containing protein [Streptosporangiaceae bacterium]